MAFLRGALKLGTTSNVHFALISDRFLLRSVVPAYKSTHAATAIGYETQTPGKSLTPKDPLDLSFNDYRAAFKSKTTWEVLRAYIVYTLCSSETLVENNAKVSLKPLTFKHRL